MFSFNNPDHDDEPTGYLGQTSQIAPPCWSSSKPNKNVLKNISNSTNPSQTKTLKSFDIRGFKLITPRLHTKSSQKQKPAGYWQHPLSPKPINTTVLGNDAMTTNSRPPTPDTHFRDLYQLYKEAPDNYKLRTILNTKVKEKLIINSSKVHTLKKQKLFSNPTIHNNSNWQWGRTRINRNQLLCNTLEQFSLMLMFTTIDNAWRC